VTAWIINAFDSPHFINHSSRRRLTILEGSSLTRALPQLIKAEHLALLVDDDADEEYYEYRHRARQHQRAPLPAISQLSITVTPRPTLRPRSPLHPPRAWGFGTPYPIFRALPSFIKQGSPAVDPAPTKAPHEPLFAHTNDTTVTKVILPPPSTPLAEAIQLDTRKASLGLFITQVQILFQRLVVPSVLPGWTFLCTGLTVTYFPSYSSSPPWTSPRHIVLHGMAELSQIYVLPLLSPVILLLLAAHPEG